MQASEDYSVPQESKKLLWEGLINNPLHSSAPQEMQEAASKIDYIGSNAPSIPVNWRFAESISAVKGFQASMLNVLLKRKYGVEHQKVVINTDHAQLFIISCFLPVIDPHGEKVVTSTEAFFRYFPDCNKFGLRLLSPCTNIYKTKDNRYFHLHGSMNHRISQQALGASDADEYGEWSEGLKAYQELVSQFNSNEIDTLMNDEHRQAGTICWSTDEYLSSPHGKANSHVGLFELHHIPNPKQAPTWWTPVEGTNASRPLLGLKVIDLTRMIASPVICRELAEMGASVLRITSPNIADVSNINLDMHWGKWNAHLDLTKEEDRATLRSLIEESDVVIDGYRPGVMAKWGFGKDDIIGFFKDKDRGVIYGRENCYGWNGPWDYRSGWQQISDACCGVSLEYGRAMGNDEPVTPVLPNSDFCTGVGGAIGVLQALIERAERGGSYVIDIALNYYSQWLINSCSVYSKEIWDKLWDNSDRRVFRHMDNMGVTIPYHVKILQKKGTPIFNPNFFEDRENKVLGVPVRTVKPILNFPDGLVKLKYNIGSRPNGVDKPQWPTDLMTEVIA